MSYRPSHKYVPTKHLSLAITKPTSRLSSVPRALIFAQALRTGASIACPKKGDRKICVAD